MIAFFPCAMHASYGAHKIVLGQGMVKVGNGNGTGACISNFVGV